MTFNILHGKDSSLEATPFHEGYCYVTHEGYFYVDLNIGTAAQPNYKRIKLNANQAESLLDYDVVPKEVYIGNDVVMPENATIQVLLDGNDEQVALENKLTDYIDASLTLQLEEKWTQEKDEIIEEVKAECVAKNQGSVNVGKILVVGTDGNFILTDMPEGGASGDVTGVLDESNNILLSGNLADGIYTLKYENTDGTYIDIGTLEVGVIPEPEPTYTNLLPLSVDENGNDYVGTHANGGDGYEYGYKVSGSTGALSAVDGAYCSGFIPLVYGDMARIYNIALNSNVSINNVSFYDANKTYIKGYGGPAGNFTSNVKLEEGAYTVYPTRWGSSVLGNVAFFRFSCGGITDETIVTVNETIS